MIQTLMMTVSIALGFVVGRLLHKAALRVSRGEPPASVKPGPGQLLWPLAGAGLFAIASHRFGSTFELSAAFIFAGLLLFTMMTDLRLRIIPNQVVYGGMIGFGVLRAFVHPLPLWQYADGFLAGGGLFYALALLTRGGIGGGDIKLFALCGLVLGLKLVLPAVFLTGLLGSFYGIVLLMTGRFDRRKPIPYAPFIAAGCWMAYIWGGCLLNLYSNI